MSLQTVLEKLNTEFGIGRYYNYLPITKNRLREIEPNQFRLSTNSGDNESQKIIESLGFNVTNVHSIIDARYVTFTEVST